VTAAMSAWAEERSAGRRWEGREGKEVMDEAATSGSGKERSERREERRSGSAVRASAGEQMEDGVRYGGEEASAAGESGGRATTEKSGFSVVFTRREKRRKKRAVWRPRVGHRSCPKQSLYDKIFACFSKVAKTVMPNRMESQ
jgi:hypothetical protein